MKILTLTLSLTLPFSLFAQDKIVGRYRDYFGSRIQLNADNTFKYTWNFDLSSSWTKGTWTLKGDMAYFHMVPTYDTVNYIHANKVTPDTLILSTDEIAERFTQEQFAVVLLSSGGQNRMNYPDKLLFRKGRLYKFQNGKPVTKKQKGGGQLKSGTLGFLKATTENLRTTGGFASAGATGKPSANCKYHLQFWLTEHGWTFEKVLYFGFLIGFGSGLDVSQLPRRTQSR